MSSWNEIKIILNPEDLEYIQGVLYTMDVKGVSIEDPQDILGREQGPLTWDFADINIFEQGRDKAVVKAYFNIGTEVETVMEEIRQKVEEAKGFGVPFGDVEILSKEVNEADWANEWKKYYKPIKVGERFVIKPLWEEYTAKEGEIILHMDPGMAFGTGTHETTRMCLEAVEDYMRADTTVFDIGTGSGILAIGASKLGAKEVVGVDLDIVAVDSAKENVGHNALDNVSILHGNLMDVVEGQADIIVANIIAEIILVLLPDVKLKLKDQGVFISSGIIREKEAMVKEALAKEGFSVLETRHQGEWVCIVAEVSHA
ncbi:50S ribosomal protein L11 methyltransferase [Proteiniclasticum sp. BAD-10]|uniref:Ribosomal protein L11 methyltransferase n=1 Tax=Proteiniclasticum sediminis TaxID=2804028 RepID=A0A941CQ22_9CLOT|nr:50S ribosomal protein L11 methyltransferase [Proteiniclasticum sediminis]MBR0576637.1 50S ribosomal protein L11 methyltransferase [Proteiniclasticum sediminis]